MIDRPEVLRSAVKASLKVRRDAGYPPTRPCDIYQLIDDRQLELQFFDVPSLEGVYLEGDLGTHLYTVKLCFRAVTLDPQLGIRAATRYESGHD